MLSLPNIPSKGKNTYAFIPCLPIDQPHWWCCTSEQCSAYTFSSEPCSICYSINFRKTHSALGADSGAMIHVLNQHFHLPWKRNRLELSRNSVCWFFNRFPNCWKRDEFISAHAGFRLCLEHLYRKSDVFLSHLVPQCKELLQQR